MSKDGGIQKDFDRSADVFMAFVCAINLLAGTGWLLNQPILASLRPEYIPMAPATVLVFLGICGAWLVHSYFSDLRWTRKLLQGALVGMLIIVFILALRYFTGLGPDFEKILYPVPAMFGKFTSARMSPLSALGICLAILAFLFLTGDKAGSHTKSVSAALSMALFILSGLICLGYLYGAPLFYGGTLIPMALTTGISFWFLSLGLLMTAGPASWPARDFTGSSMKAHLLKAFIPVSIIVVLVEGFLSTASARLIVNPAVRVAVSVLVVMAFVTLIIFFIARNLGAEFDRGKQAEQALIQSGAELRALFAGMMDVVIVLDIDGRYIEIAPTNPGNLFRPPEEMLGKTLHEILPKEQADILLSMIRHSIRTNQVANSEYVLQIDSKEKYFSASASRLSDTTAIVVAHDITNRKSMEQALQENEEKFRNLFNNAQIGMFRTRLDGSEVLDMNEKFLTIFGRTRAEMQGSTSGLHWADPFEREEMVLRLETEGEVTNLECGMLNKQQQVRKCLISMRLYRPEGILEGSILDITERKKNELVQNAIYRITQAAITSEGIDELYLSIHSNMAELIQAKNFFIALYDPVSGLINFPYYINQYDEAPLPILHTQGLTGYIIRTGLPLLATREIYDQMVGQGEVEPVGTAFVEWMGAPLKVEGRVIGVMAVQSYTEGIHFNQEDLNLLEIVSAQVAQAIERKRMEDEIRNLSLTDELTGMYNRRGFTLLTEQEIKMAHREKRSMLLFFGDVDDLKVINDTHGHAQGDLALKEVSAILKETFREADILARIGGDEFVILALDASMENEEVITNRIQGILERRNQPGNRPYPLSLSLGIACYDPEAPCKVSELITEADSRMYQQKKEKKQKGMTLPMKRKMDE